MKHPLPLSTIVVRGSHKWRVGAVMITGGERYYQLVAVGDTSDVALLPWFDVEPWAIVAPII